MLSRLSVDERLMQIKNLRIKINKKDNTLNNGDTNAKIKEIKELMTGNNNRYNKVNVTPLTYNFKLSNSIPSS